MRQVLRGVPALVVALLAVVALGAGVGAWRASGRPPLPPSLEGPCQVRAELSPAGSPAPTVVIDPSRSAGVYALPAQATIAYDAVLSAGTDPGRRRLQGSVTLALPPPFGSATLARWDEPGGRLDTSGTRRYALPARWAPVGLTLDVRAEHREPGLRCTGALRVRVAGSTTATFLRPFCVGLLVACAWLLARAAVPRPRRPDPWLGRLTGTDRWSARGRPGLGTIAGLCFGVATALVLLLAGAVPLASAWVTACPLLGVACGLGLGWWGPAGPGGRDGAATVESSGAPPEERELTILEPLGDP